MKRWQLVALWLFALAVILARPWRRGPELPWYLPEEGGRRPRAAVEEPAPLAAPEPVLVQTSKALFSRPSGSGGVTPGGLPGEDLSEWGGEPEGGSGPGGGARLGALSGAPGGAASYGGGAAGGAVVGSGGGAAGAEGAAGAAGMKRGAGPGGADSARRGAAAGDARAGFDGASAAGRPGTGGGGAASASAGSSGNAGSAGGPGGGSASSLGGGGLLGALSRFGGGGDAAATKAPGEVKGRAVGGPAVDGSAAGALGAAAAGGEPGAVAGAAVEGTANDASAERLPPGVEHAPPVEGQPQPQQPPQPSGTVFRTDRNKPGTVQTGQVRREGEKGAIVFEADMDIDADGAGGWHRADRTGQSQTALTYPGGESLNPGRLPFMVVPTDFSRTHPDVRLGDYGAISYRGRSVYAIVGDKGPAGVIGEASISAALSLGINADPNRGGVDSGVRYYILPGTADRTPPRDAATLQTRGAELFKQQGIPLR